jgi:hypothetical protein
MSERKQDYYISPKKVQALRQHIAELQEELSEAKIADLKLQVAELKATEGYQQMLIEELEAQLAAVRAALEDIAKKRLLGDIKFDYDQIILIARKAIAGEEE